MASNAWDTQGTAKIIADLGSDAHRGLTQHEAGLRLERHGPNELKTASRSDRPSVLHRPFAIKWLNLAVLWELALLVLIVYAPVLQMPFGTFSLTLKDWAIVIGLSLTISAVLELVTWVELWGWFGAMS